MSLEMAVSFAKQFSPKALEESPLLSFLVTTLSNLRRLCSLYVLQEIQDAEKKTTFGLPMPFVDLAFRKLATNVAKSAAEGGPLMEDFFPACRPSVESGFGSQQAPQKRRRFLP
jgi:hypothetical protein